MIRGKLLDAKDARIYYEVLRQDPVIVYLHGNGVNHTTLNNQRAHFHNLGAGSIAPDQRGEGKSTHLPNIEAYTLEAYTSDLEKIIAAETVQRVTVVGQSKGAMVALNYAAKHPDNVDAVVSICGSYNFLEGFRKRSPKNWLMPLKFLVEPLGMALNGASNLIYWNRDEYYPDFSEERFRKMSDTEFVLRAYMMNNREYVRATNAVGNAVDKWDIKETVTKITAPTLLINGADDVWVPPQTAYDLQEMIPGAKGIPPVIIPKGRHGVPFQAPEQVNAAMERFLVGEVYAGRLGAVNQVA